jgi:hypothetical protein
MQTRAHRIRINMKIRSPHRRRIVFALTLVLASAGTVAEAQHQPQQVHTDLEWSPAVPSAAGAISGTTPWMAGAASLAPLHQSAGVERSASTLRVGFGAAAGVVVGVAAGVAVGNLLDPAPGPGIYFPASGIATATTLMGLAVGPGVGAHLANRREGNAIRTIAASTLAGAAMAGVVIVSGEGRLMFALPAAQVVAATWTERAASR